MVSVYGDVVLVEPAAIVSAAAPESADVIEKLQISISIPK
jgi:hypothetical protein